MAFARKLFAISDHLIDGTDCLIRHASVWPAHKKGKRNKPLSKREKKANTRKSRVRARVEHVFGSITNEQGGLYFRVIGRARTAVKIGMMNVVYNMRRFVTLHRISASAH